MSDPVLRKFLELKGVVEPTKKQKVEQQKKNEEYIIPSIKVNQINKLIEEKPKEKYIVKYFQLRLQELDDEELDD
jgi:hypothetical protein